jgi:hypothetical protein
LALTPSIKQAFIFWASNLLREIELYIKVVSKRKEQDTSDSQMHWASSNFFNMEVEDGRIKWAIVVT